MKIFDTHFHLNENDDLEGIINRADSAGVSMMLVAGSPVGEIPRMLTQISMHSGVFGAIGVHPHEAEKFDGSLEEYEQWTRHPKVKAIGEIGLDYFYDNSPRENQESVFRSFLQLAHQVKKPAIVHCRDAFDDCYRLLAETLKGDIPFVIHCYTGTEEWARKFIALNGYLSFNGILTFKKSENIREVFRKLPLDRIFFETDSPYLAPIPHRGKTNEPAYLTHVIDCAAQELQVDRQELIDLSTRTAMNFFNL